jgi:signal transduction histidine kinase
MPSFAESIRQIVYPRAVRSAVPPALDKAFLASCNVRLERHGKVLIGVVLACDLVWWPLDWIVFQGVPGWLPVLLRIRIGLAVACLLYLFVPRPAFLRRASYWLLTAAVCAGIGLACDGAGELGGPERPYFHPLYVTMFGTVPLPLPLGRRALMGGLAGASATVGFLARHTEHLASSHLPLTMSFLVFTILLSTWFGHLQFVLSRDNFVQAHELAEHGRLLESRVAERTKELRGLLDHVETAREAERARIARELHDELGQELSALRYSLSFTKVRYGKEPTDIAANLEDLESLLRRTTQTTRNLVTDLRPRVLDDLGLEAAVEWLVRRTEQRSDLQCKLSVSGELSEMAERTATTAFRVLQEAMTNAARHAGAKELSIELSAKDGQLTLRVADDGIGIDAGRTAKDEKSTGVGLIGMRERVHAVGGNLSIRDLRPGRGTEIRCTLPLFPTSARPARVAEVAS